MHIAAVSTGFPSGQYPLSTRLEETRRAVGDGADEIDMVIDRGAFLSGQYAKVFDEIAAVRLACGPAHLKVILETGELAVMVNGISLPGHAPIVIRSFTPQKVRIVR